MNYTQQLDDPRWKIKADAIRTRDRHSCQCCGNPGFDVHHLRYNPDGALWDVPNEWLETLCRECHDKRTEIDRAHRLKSTREVLLGRPTVSDEAIIDGIHGSGTPCPIEKAAECVSKQTGITESEAVNRIRSLIERGEVLILTDSRRPEYGERICTVHEMRSWNN